MIKEKIENKFILIIGTALIFLNLTIYLPYIKAFPFPAYFLDILIFLILAFLYFKKGLVFPFSNKALLWIIYYASVSFLYFIVSDAGDDEWHYLILVISVSFFFISYIMLFTLDDNNLTVTRVTMVFLAPIASITLGIDYFIPEFWNFGIFSEYYTLGRAASIYLNANIAGGAMVIFLIFGIDMIPKKYRILFIIIVFLGLFFTMSRSNIMIMFIVLTIMFLQKKLYSTHLLFIFISIILFFSWLSFGGFDYLEERYDLKVTEDMRNRVNFFLDDKETDIGDMDERGFVLNIALEMFMNKPLLGNGFASTRLWDYRVAPHNTFVMLWADYGVIGVSIIPLLFFLSTYFIFKYGNREQKQLALLVILYFTLSSFFSHNMLEQPLQLATLIALSVIGYKEKNSIKEGSIV